MRLTLDLQINKGHQQVLSKLPMKFHYPRPKRSEVIIQKPFYFSEFLRRPLTYWRVICKSYPTFLWSFMILGQSILKFSSGNRSISPDPCDLDLWHTDPKINRGHLQVMTYIPVIHDPWPRCSQVIIWKPFGIRTDGSTDRHQQNNIPPLLRSGA